MQQRTPKGSQYLNRVQRQHNPVDGPRREGRANNCGIFDHKAVGLHISFFTSLREKDYSISEVVNDTIRVNVMRTDMLL